MPRLPDGSLKPCLYREPDKLSPQCDNKQTLKKKIY